MAWIIAAFVIGFAVGFAVTIGRGIHLADEIEQPDTLP